MSRPAVRPPSGQPLVGRVVRLDPVTPDDVDGLVEVWSDPEVYRHGFLMARPPADRAEAAAMVADQVAARPSRWAYTVRLVADTPLGRAGTVVGTSSLGDVDLENEHVHLGWTTYGSRWWGTAVNPEAKLLLLGHAVDDCGFGRVRIQTDVLNERSQAAIARLGAVREGVLRRVARRADGSWRDTVVFSVLHDEWPAVRAGLRERVDRALEDVVPT